MRRSDREVKDLNTIKEIISKCEVVRLAMCEDNIPYIVPLNYGYEFDGNKMTKVTQTSSITAEGDFAKYIDDYKDSAQTTADGFNKLNGFSAKVEASNNKVSVVVEMNPKKMSTDDYESYSMGENYDSMKAKLTDQGYTCK